MKWYTYSINEVWIIEKLTDYVSHGGFEPRKYKCNGTLEKEFLDCIDGISYINKNKMKKMKIKYKF